MRQKLDVVDYYSTKFIETFIPENIMTTNRKNWMFRCVKSSVKEIPLRTLISEIHRLKREGKLFGLTPEEEYCSYIKEYLSNEEYQVYFKQKFPEIYHIMKIVLDATILFISEVMTRTEKYHKKINQIFFPDRHFETIADIDLDISDPHNHGQRTAKVFMDNGIVLYYKPHGIQKNILYQKVYNYICRKVKLAEQNVKYLDCGNYGWEEEVKPSPCTTVEEVRRFYMRMGIHLFLAYILSSSDLHGENIIAVGEYPVIVDFETFPGFTTSLSENDVTRRINEFIGDSVQHTGLLPCLVWRKDSNAVIVSALGNNRKITTPFRMPVIKNDKTSNICIQHELKEIEIARCTAWLKGKEMSPIDYTEELCMGFCKAYQCFLKDKNLKPMLLKFFEGKSRIVLRHTQQYFMYRFISLHPDFCCSAEARKNLLSVLYRDHEREKERETHAYEVESLLRMDIPFFEVKGDSTSLFDGDGKEYTEYFPNTPFEGWLRKISQLGIQDLEKQMQIIRLSIALLSQERKLLPKVNGYLPRERYKSFLNYHICKIAEWLSQVVFRDNMDIVLRIIFVYAMGFLVIYWS